MRRIVEKGMGQVKHVGGFILAGYSSKSTKICNEYGRSNVSITDSRQTFVQKSVQYLLKKHGFAGEE